jgi:hypothetical protein
MTSDPALAFLQDIKRDAFDAFPLDALGLGEGDGLDSLCRAWNSAFAGIIERIFARLTANPGEVVDPIGIISAMRYDNLARETRVPQEKLVLLARCTVSALLRYGSAYGAANIRQGGKTFILFRTDPGQLHAELAA